MDEYYKIRSSIMTEIADCTRALSSRTHTMTPQQIIFWLSQRIKDWNLKTSAKDEVSTFPFTTPSITLNDCSEDVKIVLQQEDRLNTYEDSISGDKFLIKTPKMSKMSENPNIIDSLNDINPFSGELVTELEEYDDNVINTSFEILVSMRTTWSFNSAEETITDGIIGVLPINTDVIPQDNISSIKVVKV